ncbi:MAG: HEAT repeat domain-containing protein [Ignavibacteriales bacterium]|nr:HEAT repeat domain-containing protein [Ignavibacteriales bacterium]
MKIFLSPILFFILTITALPAQAQQMVKFEKFTGDVARQFESILQNDRPDGNFWIGYSIVRNDDNQFIVGSYSFDNDNAITLRDVITNSPKFKDRTSSRDKSKKGNISGRMFGRGKGISISTNGTDRETAVLFLYDKNTKNIDDFSEVSICNLSLSVELSDHPLFWLGEAGTKKSIDFLFATYKKLKKDESKEDLVSAIGIHTDQHVVTSFLIDVINSKSDDEVRENSVFWLGYQNNTDAFAALKKIIASDPSFEMRKHAVWSLSYMNLPAATDELIAIAKKNGNNELRKQAVYGLGNKAVAKAEETLKDIVEDDPDLEIKKHAVYALANTSDDIVPYLITVARSHRSLSIRKCAIWSLGNSRDERAVDALILLAENK